MIQILKSICFLVICLCVIVLLFSVLVSASSPDDPADAEFEIFEEDPVELPEDETENPSEDPAEGVSYDELYDAVMKLAAADEEVESDPEPEPVEGEISDGEFKAYVLGFLTFFTAVLLAYFGYRFFAMFF